MSRSRKRNVFKVSPRNGKKSSSYWRPIRSRIKNIVNKMKYDPELELPSEKTLINDANYCEETYLNNPNEFIPK